MRELIKRKEKKVSKVYLEEELIDIECEGIQIGNQEHDEMLQRISSRIPIPIESFAFVKNMSPRLNWIVIAWT